MEDTALAGLHLCSPPDFIMNLCRELQPSSHDHKAHVNEGWTHEGRTTSGLMKLKLRGPEGALAMCSRGYVERRLFEV